MRLAFLLFLASSSLYSSANAQGYRGRDFWICFPQNAQTEQRRILQNTIFITSESRTTGQIENLMDGSRTPFSIEAGASTFIQLDTVLQILTSGTIEQKSVHVTSEKEISLYVVSHRPSSTDSYAAIPTEFLGKSYSIVGYDPLPSSSSVEGFTTQADVIATEENTLVTLTLTAATADGLPKGRTLSMALNRGQTLQLKSALRSSELQDLTATHVTSSKPIAFFTGHTCAQVPADMSYCDILLEMEPPETDWGKEFILTNFTGKDYYVARVVASSDSTEVTMNGQVAARLMKGRYFEARHLTNDVVVRTSKPALVAQYATSSEADTIKIGDPFMLLAIPNDRFITELTTISLAAGGFYHYLNIVVPDSGLETLQIDGKRAAFDSASPSISLHSKHKVPATKYSVLSYKVSDGRHLISCDLPIAVYSYGFGVLADNYDSYGHACGQRLEK